MVALDRVFELLSDERRRYTLYYLRQEEGLVPVEDLAETIVAWEDDPPEKLLEDRLEDVEIELLHKHLPRAAEVEFIEYLPDEGLIRAHGLPTEVGALVTLARLIEQPADDA